jgi:hypothetical protein
MNELVVVVVVVVFVEDEMRWGGACVDRRLSFVVSEQ